MLHFYPGPYAMLSAYLDESGTDGSSPAMVIAGVLYDEEGVKRIDAELKAELETIGASFFHAVDMAHSRGEFKGKTAAALDQTYRRLIASINKHSLGGVGICTIPENEFDAFRAGKWPHSQYATCVHVCMDFLLRIARELGHDEVKFFIENGHKNIGELNSLLRERRDNGLDFGPYVIEDKRANRPLQTADVYAWEYAKRAKDLSRDSEKAPRLSLISLTENPSMKFLILNRPRLQILFEANSGEAAPSATG